MIEDDPNLLEVIQTVLQAQNYHVVGAASGEMALELVAAQLEQPFDLIIADIRMEGIDGLEALARSRRYLPGVGTLVISGYAGPEEISRARAMAVGGFLKKPFAMKDFLSEVSRILGNLAHHRRHQQKEHSLLTAQKWLCRTIFRVSARPELETLNRWTRQLAHQSGYSQERADDLSYMLRWHWLAKQQVVEVPTNEQVSGQLPWLQPTSSDQPMLELLHWAVAQSPSGQNPPPLNGSEPPVAQELAQSYAAISENSAAANPPAPVSETALRSLLGLAQSLESAGDWKNAWKVYEELLAKSREPGQRCQVLCHQAFLAAHQGRSDIAEQKAQLALEMAARLDLAARANASLELLHLISAHSLNNKKLREELLQLAHQSLTQVGRRSDLLLLRLLGPQTGPDSPAQLSEAEILGLFDSLDERAHSNGEHFVGPLLQWAALHGSVEVARQALRLGFDNLASLILAWQPYENQFSESLAQALEAETLWAPAGWVDYLSRHKAWKSLAARMETKARELSHSSVLRVQSFSSFKVLYGGQTVPETRWRGQKLKAMLAYLMSRWGEPVSDDVLVDIFWEDDAEKGERNLYWSISNLRSCLRDLGIGVNGLIRQGSHLVINPDIPHWHDFAEFNKHRKAASAALADGRDDYAYEQLKSLRDCYSGPYLDGYYFDWAVQLRHDCERDFMEALDKFGWLQFRRKEFAGSLETARQILNCEEDHAGAHLLTMRAHLRLGDSSKAIEQFQRCETVLKRNHGVEPSIEMLRYYQRARYGLGDED